GNPTHNKFFWTDLGICPAAGQKKASPFYRHSGGARKTVATAWRIHGATPDEGGSWSAAGKSGNRSPGVACESCNWPSKYTRTMNPPYLRPSAEGNWIFGRT